MKLNSQKVKSLLFLSLLNFVQGEEEKLNNQNGIPINPEIIQNHDQSLKFAANFAKQKIVKRDDFPAIDLIAGYPILFVDKESKIKTKNCTAGFAVRNTSPGIYPNWFITSGRCVRYGGDNWVISPSIDGVISNHLNWGYTGVNDFAFVNTDPETHAYKWTTIPYTLGLSTNNKTKTEPYPVAQLAGYPAIGSTICAYGSTSGYRCGKIVESEVEITINDPLNGAPSVFQGLGKVDLGGNGFENEGDLGGPVYLEVGEGNSKVAQALGHITNADNSDPNHKLLYYTLLDKVFSAFTSSGGIPLELLTTVNDPSASSTTSTTLLASTTTSSTSVPTSTPTLLFSGYPISFENQKNCTVAFIGNKQGIDGFITSARCCIKNNCNLVPNQSSDNVYENNDDGNVTLIGGAYDIRFGEDGLEYVFVTSILTDWDNTLYTIGLSSGNETASQFSQFSLYPVNSYSTLTEADKGIKVCAYGVSSGGYCGELDKVNVTITVPNPWTSGLTNLTVNRVYLGTKGFVSEEDLGGPVYLPANNDNETTTDPAVQALGHITNLFSDERAGRKYFYYTPIDRVLSTGNIELTTRFSPKADSLQKRQIEEGFQTHVEIPAKN